MAVPFLSLNDTRNRVHRTVCMFKDRPVYCQVEDVNLLKCRPLRSRPTGPDLEVWVQDSEFSYKSPPLGYLNYENAAWYVMRIPTRQIRAGLSPELLTTEPRGINPADFLMTKAFEDCILGNHPSLANALEKLKKIASVAIHRHVALVNDGPNIMLHYRAVPVGSYDPHTNSFLFAEGPQRSFIERIVQNLHLQGIADDTGG